MIAEFLIIAMMKVPERRNYGADRLGKHDLLQVLRIGETQRKRGFDLPLTHCEYARTDRLRDVGRRIEAQAAGARRERPMFTPARRSPAKAMNNNTSSGMLRKNST